MYFKAELLVLIVSLLICTLASPAHEDFSSDMVVPPEAHKVALDEVNKRLVAFDGEGRHLGYYNASAVLPMKKRDESQLSCAPMNEHEIPSLPGINVLRDFADAHFSIYPKRREVVNDDHRDTRNLEALICTSEEGGQMHFDAKPTCTTMKGAANGSLADGFMMITIRSVSFLESVSTVVQQSNMGIGREFSTKWSIGGVDIDFGQSSKNSWMNKHGHSHRMRQEVTTEQTYRQLSKHDLQCVLVVTKETCVLTGSAHVWMIATGWLWFEYEKTVGPKGNKHYKWAVNMDKILPNERDRGSLVKFRTSGNMQPKGTFHAEGCTDDMFEIIMPSHSGGVPVPRAT